MNNMPEMFKPQMERAAIRIGSFNGHVVVEFEKSVNHLQMSVDEAVALAKALMGRANEVAKMNGDRVN